jgi:hypothetical protein
MRCILLILIISLNQGCIGYFSKPRSTRLYKPTAAQVSSGSIPDSLQVLYSITYDSTAQKPEDEAFLVHG